MRTPARRAAVFLYVVAGLAPPAVAQVGQQRAEESFKEVQALVGCTPYPDEAFVIQCLRQITGETGLLREGRILLCDRDPKWSGRVEQWLATAGVRVIRTPPRAPNCNADAERFVRSVKEECLNRVVPLGERHLRTTLQEFVAH